jgi:hypothetical protein
MFRTLACLVIVILATFTSAWPVKEAGNGSLHKNGTLKKELDEMTELAESVTTEKVIPTTKQMEIESNKIIIGRHREYYLICESEYLYISIDYEEKYPVSDYLFAPLDPISIPVRHLADGGILYRHALTCQRMVKEERYDTKARKGRKSDFG